MKAGFYLMDGRLSENDADHPFEWMDGGGFNGGPDGVYATKQDALKALCEIAEYDYKENDETGHYAIAEVTVLETESRHVFSIKGERAPDGEGVAPC